MSILKKQYWLGLLILLPAVVIRFLWLGEVPGGVNHDEADIIQTARTYAYFGTDQLGNPFPRSLISRQASAEDDTLLALLLSPVYRWLPINNLVLRLPMVAINLLTAIVFGLVGWQLGKKRRLGIILGLVFLYSPWSLMFARQVLIAPLALLFILLAILLYIRKKVFLAAGTLMLAWLAYFGAKPMVAILAIGLPVTDYLRTKYPDWGRWIKWWAILGMGGAIYFGAASLLPNSTWGLRAKEINSNQNAQWTRVVDEARRTTISGKMDKVFINKFTVRARDMLSKYTSFWAPDFLFFSGDPNATSRFGEHGLAYLPDGVFFLWGITAATQLPLLSLGGAILLIIGPVGTMVNNSGLQLVWRGFLWFPGFLIFVALGIWKMGQYKSKLLVGLVLAMYTVATVNFGYFYFFRYPIPGAEINYFSERIVANYIRRTGSPVLVVSRRPISTWQEIAIYSGVKKPQIITETGPLVLANATVTSECPPQKPGWTVVIDAGISCPAMGRNDLVIQDQKDTGSVWKIYNDNLCSREVTDKYRREHKREDYAVEKMGRENFCNRWIAKY